MVGLVVFCRKSPAAVLAETSVGWLEKHCFTDE
jgi:hypothetical protein